MKDLLKELEAQEAAIVVVGLGYVGLPLACLLSSRYKVVGFDIDARRIEELNKGVDATREITDKAKLLNDNLLYTNDSNVIGQSRFIIVAVPTPIDNHKKPDLTPLISASKLVGENIGKDSVVVYESTVYPGVTQGKCREVLEEYSGLVYQQDFYLGYSPERVNPGDRDHTIDKITKVVSGSNHEILKLLSRIYGSVITAGVHEAPSIEIAEAAKVIENTQRDLNIALVNELALIFERIGLDTLDVIAAAATKWNFLPFKPGLVGGHCIGVDPYYLTHLAEGLGLHPEVINAGRRINDNMGVYVAQKTLRLIFSQGQQVQAPIKVAILGVTFKENIPDLRNTRVVDIADELEKFGSEVYFVDPVAEKEEFEREYNKTLSEWDALPECDAIVLAVGHSIFNAEYPLQRLITKFGKSKIVVDVKGSLCREEAKKYGITIWRL